MQSQTHTEAQRTFLSTAGLTRFSEVFFFWLLRVLAAARGIFDLCCLMRDPSLYFFQLRHQDLFCCSKQDLVP